MANNKVAYGLAKKYGIDTTGMTPKEVWDALKERGISQADSSEKFKEVEELKTKSIDELHKKSVVKINKNTLSSQEWALWYKAVAENKALGYWAEELDNGNALLKVENKNSHKLIITGGTFEKPKAIAIYSFSNVDKMNDFIKELKK